MARTVRGKPSIQVCLLLFAAIFLRTSPCGFGRPRQQPSSELREQAGMTIRTRAADLMDVKLSPEEKLLVTEISDASEKKDWSTAKSLFDGYAGSASPVYAAAMHAAWRCRLNKEGAKIYERCRTNCEYVGLPAFSMALKLFGKLGEEAMVQRIWDDALEAHALTEVLGAARIAAAADAGNVTAAAEALHIMNASNVSINVYHITSAIRACWAEGDQKHRYAKYFFDLMPEFNITPNVVTFASLLGTYSSLSLQEVLSAYKEMQDLDIEPNRIFAETYVFTLLQTRGKRIKEQLARQSTERLQAARNALDEFKGAGVPLSGACEEADRELTRMGF
eukprot:Skav201453  [mRNA]  locus=scaffold6:280360:281364:+ [translate_table: standard]